MAKGSSSAEWEVRYICSCASVIPCLDPISLSSAFAFGYTLQRWVKKSLTPRASRPATLKSLRLCPRTPTTKRREPKMAGWRKTMATSITRSVRTHAIDAHGLISAQMNLKLFLSLMAMSFLWVGSQIPLYLFGSVLPLIYSDIGGVDRYVWFVIGYLIPNAALW
jgi:hypothetical protein